MSKAENVVTCEQARAAIDSLDDFARMQAGVDPFGPRELLCRFVEQYEAALARADVAQVGYLAAVERAQWQASTNAELNRLIQQRNALEAELKALRASGGEAA